MKYKFLYYAEANRQTTINRINKDIEKNGYQVVSYTLSTSKEFRDSGDSVGLLVLVVEDNPYCCSQYGVQTVQMSELLKDAFKENTRC